ncbi:MAG TPA: hypothetical protein VHZ55_12905 [Bryobacteraceae bacterium]|nr:hypothetical protein [Bryobacteraceae bacterium]
MARLSKHHRDAIRAFDVFTAQPLLFPHHLVLLLVIEHARWCILHFNVTLHPTSDWLEGEDAMA